MEFYAIPTQVITLLQRERRVSYRALKRQFNLDDDYIEDLKAELIYAKRLAVDEEGRVLVWVGDTGAAPESVPPLSRPMQQPVLPDGGPTAVASAPVESQPPEAERRQLTVLFCNLVDSTVLASRLDHEEWREVVRAYQATCAKVIARFEGHIAQYLGDGLLVYFGYPYAHEDDAPRAVRAGLGMVEAMGQLNTRLVRERGVHLGCHTGLVVVGDVGGGTRREQLALGETPNLATRLQGLAAPNTLVISAATVPLLGGFFACQSLGTHLLKGVAQPIEVNQVRYESTARSRLEAAGRTSLTPLVGREQEVALLRERWAQVKDGLGQVVLLSGEAGIGKSRLVQVLTAHVATEPQAWLTPCQCSPYYQHSALYPWIDLLERVALRFEREESAQQKLRKLEGLVVQYGLPLAEAVPLFAALLSLPLPADYAPPTMSPEQQKQKTLQALLTIMLKIAAQQPMLFVMEDLHWVDPSTLGLQQLVAAEFLYQRGLPPQATYLFKHALIQDAAYQSLLRSTRQQHHQRIAQVLEVRFPEVCDTQPELLAHHYTEADLNAQAIPYWQRAGQRAVERSANLEAVAHLSKGLEGLATLPDTPERAQQELLVQTTLGPALMATKGYGSPEVLRTYARARELCQHVGETPQLFQVLRGLWYFYLIRLELRTARELGEQLLTLAQHVGDSALLLESHYALGNTLNYLGEFAAARAYLEQGIALYDPQRHRAHAFRYGQDPGVACRSYAAVTLWWLGYPDQALQRSHEALTLAREVAHPFSLAYVLFFAALLHHFRREGQLTQERAEEQVALSGERGFPQLLAGGRFFQGWALVEQGRGAEGMAQMHQGMAAWRATGAEVIWPYYLALLAEADAKGGQVEESLTLVAEALAAANNREERRWDAELYRLKGKLLQDSAAHQVEAEESLEQALAVARRQEAKSLELRAAMSLSRLWQQQGERAGAHALLAPIYGWFTEGFDTADLREARALLEELA